MSASLQTAKTGACPACLCCMLAHVEALHPARPPARPQALLLAAGSSGRGAMHTHLIAVSLVPATRCFAVCPAPLPASAPSPCLYRYDPTMGRFPGDEAARHNAIDLLVSQPGHTPEPGQQAGLLLPG